MNKKKKVCMVYYSVYFTMALLNREAKALIESGFDVDIIALGNQKRSNNHIEEDGVNVFLIQNRPHREKNVISYAFNLGTFWIRCFLYFTFYAIRKYRAVIFTSPPDGMVFTAIVPKIFGARIILDVHDIGPELFMEKTGKPESSILIKMIKIMEKLSVKFADHVFIVTEMWRNRLIQRGAREEKVDIILNSPDHEIFFPIDRSVKYDNVFQLIYHGSLELHSGVDDIIKAMGVLNNNHKNIFKLDIYGSGRLEGFCHDEIKRLKLKSAVQIHKPVPFRQLPDIIKNYDIGIVPMKDTQFAKDTISMKALEYLSMNIPIVISNTIAHCYYFNEDFVCYYIAANYRDLASKVEYLYANPAETLRIKENIRKNLEPISWGNYKHVFVDNIIKY